MSETINDETTNTITETTETPIPGSESTPGPTNNHSEIEDTGDGTNEAQNGSERPMPREQRYRLELRAAEKQRDELAKQVRELQLRDAERLASRGLSEPADLFTLGKVELEDLLDDSGFVDGEKVQSVVSDILGSRPGLRTADRAVDRSQALGEPGKADLSWSDLLKAEVTGQ